MSACPSPNGRNGRPERDGYGRFLPGHAGGPGNPYGRQTAKLRAALLSSVSEDALKMAVAALVQKAQTGDVVAIRELLDRTLGKPSQSDLVERVEKLEAMILEAHQQ